MSSCPCEGLRCKLEALDGRHGSRYGYAKLGCRCAPCRGAQRVGSAAYKAEHRDELNAAQRARHYEHVTKRREPKLTKPLAEVLRAGRLLADGASYRETARTVGWDELTVARIFPGRGWSSREVAAFAALHSPAIPKAA